MKSGDKKDLRMFFLNKLQELAKRGDNLTAQLKVVQNKMKNAGSDKDACKEANEAFIKASIEGISIVRDSLLACAMYMSEVEPEKAINILGHQNFQDAMGTVGRGVSDLKDFVMKMAVLSE